MAYQSHDGDSLGFLPLNDLGHSYWPQFPFLHSGCLGQFQLSYSRIM